jgi:sialate O-acetylesterase
MKPEDENIELFAQMRKPTKTASGKIHSPKWPHLIHPLTSMSIFGAIWYQGESNTFHASYLYNCTFPALIRDWRQRWFMRTNGSTNPRFPFGFVQYQSVYPHVSNETDKIKTFPYLRFHQTGMAKFCLEPFD